MPREICRESNPFAAESVWLNSPGRAVDIKARLPMFVSQKWHRFYAGALMETESTRLCLSIALTEEAILDRCIALIAEESESDEILDLQNAITVLSELREANQIGLAVSNLVA
jgi:hypothetical protein